MAPNTKDQFADWGHNSGKKAMATKKSCIKYKRKQGNTGKSEIIYRGWKVNQAVTKVLCPCKTFGTSERNRFLGLTDTSKWGPAVQM